MADEPVPLTSAGLARLKEELDYLSTVGRKEMADRIIESREDRTEGGSEYSDAKTEQALLEQRITTLQSMLRNAVLIDNARGQASGRVLLGSRVRLRSDQGQERTYQIVGPAEADPGQGRISNESPVGRALLGKQAGEMVQVVAPGGVVRMRVEAIE